MNSCDVFKGGRRLQRSLLDGTAPPTAVAEELAAQLEELAERVAALEALLRANEPPATRTAGGWVAFVASPDGYRIHELDGSPPEEGQLVKLDGRAHAVTRLAASPFPDDDRPCAYLELDVDTPPLASPAWRRSTS
ncbi:MAG TPA: hypothetical protein VFA19_00985 [Gaiellaceae bacterium]|nr:hypothetical protein [Gaiellaceae bacterium]